MLRHVNHAAGPYIGRTAVITGAGGGIGSALARQLASQGATLALVDCDAVQLAQVRAQCADLGADVMTAALDVRTSPELEAFARDCRSRFGHLDDLFTCAGAIHVGALADSNPEDIRQVLDIDVFGTILAARALLPHLAAAPNGGRIVTLSSGFGLIGVSDYTAYCAAKFAVRGFTEALQAEVRSNGLAIQVCIVYPGGVRTEIMRRGTYASSADPEKVQRIFDRYVARTSPDSAARAILSKVARGHRRIRLGPETTLADLAARISTSGYQWALDRRRPTQRLSVHGVGRRWQS